MLLTILKTLSPNILAFVTLKLLSYGNFLIGRRWFKKSNFELSSIAYFPMTWDNTVAMKMISLLEFVIVHCGALLLRISTKS